MQSSSRSSTKKDCNEMIESRFGSSATGSQGSSSLKKEEEEAWNSPFRPIIEVPPKLPLSGSQATNTKALLIVPQ